MFACCRNADAAVAKQGAFPTSAATTTTKKKEPEATEGSHSSSAAIDDTQLSVSEAKRLYAQRVAAANNAAATASPRKRIVSDQSWRAAAPPVPSLSEDDATDNTPRLSNTKSSTSASPPRWPPIPSDRKTVGSTPTKTAVEKAVVVVAAEKPAVAVQEKKAAPIAVAPKTAVVPSSPKAATPKKTTTKHAAGSVSNELQTQLAARRKQIDQAETQTPKPVLQPKAVKKEAVTTVPLKKEAAPPATTETEKSPPATNKKWFQMLKKKTPPPPPTNNKQTLVLPTPIPASHQAHGPTPPTSRKPIAMTPGYKECTHLDQEDVQAYELWYQLGLLPWRPANGDESPVVAVPTPNVSKVVKSAALVTKSPVVVESPSSGTATSTPYTMKRSPSRDHSRAAAVIGGLVDEDDYIEPSLQEHDREEIVTMNRSDDDDLVSELTTTDHIPPSLLTPPQRVLLSRSSSCSSALEGSVLTFGSPCASSRASRNRNKRRQAPIVSLFGSPVRPMPLINNKKAETSNSSVTARVQEYQKFVRSYQTERGAAAPPQPLATTPRRHEGGGKYQNYVQSYKNYVGDNRSPQARAERDQAWRNILQDDDDKKKASTT